MPLVNEVVIGLPGQGQVQRLEAEGRRPVRDLRDQPDAAGAGRDRAGDAGHRADQLPAHRPGHDVPDRHRRRQPAEGVLRLAGDRSRLGDAAPEHGDRADAEASQNRLGLLGGLLGPAPQDLAGYPNGRRPNDDVVDISLIAVMGGLCVANGNADTYKLGAACKPSAAPLGTAAFGLHDGVDQAGPKVKAAARCADVPVHRHAAAGREVRRGRMKKTLLASLVAAAWSRRAAAATTTPPPPPATSRSAGERDQSIDGFIAYLQGAGRVGGRHARAGRHQRGDAADDDTGEPQKVD